MKGNCAICGTEIEIKLCCSGRDCGCMGLPIEPPVCEKYECYDEFVNKNENTSQEPRKDQPFHLES